MKRREFLNLSLPATGAVFLAPGLFNMQAMAEINRQFSGKSNFEEYDIVINGAGLAGYFAAVHAAEKGKKVLIVEKRTSPGYEIAAKGKLWMGAEGLKDFRLELATLFFPEEEKQEAKNSTGNGDGPDRYGDEMLLFSGSIRKGMLRNLLMSKVHVLLMTDVCGILTDNENVKGVLLASKHGVHAVNCRNFIDASDQLLFSRGILENKYQISRAGFVLEMSKVINPQKKEISVPSAYGLQGNKVRFHKGKLSDEQLFMEFEFPVLSQRLEEIEHQARLISAKLGENLKQLDGSLQGAQINQFSLETSIFLEDETLPKPVLIGHYLLPNSASELSCSKILEIEKSAKSLVNGLKYTKAGAKTQSLVTIGNTISVGDLKFSEVQEPGLSVPIQDVEFDFHTLVKNREQCQVLVAGGGTGGAFATIGALEKGANTIVVDYFNDLGGTKTMGGVMGYYHGVTENKFFQKQSEDAERIAFETNMTKKTGRKLYHLKGVLEAEGRFIGGAIICNALSKNQTVNGILICRHGKLEALDSPVTIDATGDGDVASFAGAEFQIGGSRIGETQNYSQWDIPGAGNLPSPTNRDYDVIDNTKISELQRGLFLSHYEAHFYDFHPMLTVRESRRIEGMYVLDLLDAAEGTHFEDVISLASSDFDPHNVGSSEFSKCGFLLPHSNDLVVEIPYRCIVPKDLDGLLISGRGISQSHNALQFTRMTADIIVLGYLTGQVAADLAWNNIQPRKYDISGIQREWANLEYLPADYSRKSTSGLRYDEGEIRRRITQLASGEREYLYECSRLPKEKTVPVLLEYYYKPVQKEEKLLGEGKLLLAKALAWFGNPIGIDLIEDELKDMFAQELADGYPEGYVDDYDFIRGREKNMLEGLFWRINQNIGLLAMAGDPKPNGTINHILQNTVSGGGMVERTSDYYNGRIDLKIIPFYNRIQNLCFYAERIPDPLFIPSFEKLLKDDNIGGFQTEVYDQVRWRVFGGLLEVSVAAAMARCGAKSGYNLLVNYMDDIHYNFKSFALKELKSLTGANHGYESASWRKVANSLSYPQPVKKIVKAIEV